MAIKDVSDLKVYNQSLELIAKMYALLKLLSRSEFVLINQIRRAIQSIPANIAEGFAKKHSEKEFRRCLLIALGSSDEVITHLRTLIIVCPEYTIQAQSLINKYKILSKRIDLLYKSWNVNNY